MKTDMPFSTARIGSGRLLIAGLSLVSILSGQVRDVPSNPVQREEGSRERPALKEVPFLGVSTHRVDAALAAKMTLPRETGLLVARVLPESPADRVLKPRDLLTHLDDQPLSDPRQLGLLVRARKDGDEVRLTLFRAGKQMTVNVVLAKKAMPPLPEPAPPPLP